MIEGIIEKIEVVLEWISSIVLVSLLFIVWAQITFRYIFNNSLAWTEESARYLMIWGVLLGANLAFLKGYFISINLFVHRLPVKLQIAFRVLRKLLALFFTGILCCSRNNPSGKCFDFRSWSCGSAGNCHFT